MLYKDMTPEERRAAYEDYAEALEIHLQGFAARASRGSRADREAEAHASKCEREMNFIERVARSKGDAWVRGIEADDDQLGAWHGRNE